MIGCIGTSKRKKRTRNGCRKEQEKYGRSILSMSSRSLTIPINNVLVGLSESFRACPSADRCQAQEPAVIPATQVLYHSRVALCQIWTDKTTSEITGARYVCEKR